MSIGQTLDRQTDVLSRKERRKEGRSIRGSFDDAAAAVAWSSSQSSLIIAFFPPQSGRMSGDRGENVDDEIFRLRRIAHSTTP